MDDLAQTTETADTAAYRLGRWRLHRELKWRKSANGINLVFIPGQNVVLELNEVAGDVMQAFAAGPVTYGAVMEHLGSVYDTDGAPDFQAEVDQLLERFARHGVIVAAEADADAVQEAPNEARP